MSFVSRWTAIASALPPDWSDARLLLSVERDGDADRAAALLAPLNPGRSGRQIRLFCTRRGPGVTPESLKRALERLDRERLAGRLELAGSDRAQPAPAPEPAPTLAGDWDATLATLPPDWSDLYAELELTSSDHLDRVALLTSPLNPKRFAGKPGFRFRIARTSGYGVSPAMARRSLERVDEEEIPGSVSILRVLSDTDNVKTQGPVWRVDGAAV